MNTRAMTFATIVIAALATLAQAQSSDPKPAPTTPTTPAAPEPKPATPPSLDDLLGLTPAPIPKPVDPNRPADNSKPVIGPDGKAIDPSRANLNRVLSGEELQEAFKKAVALMGDAAARLDEHRDSGLDTQRIQEEALRNLDELLSQMQKNQSQQSQGQPRPQKQKQQQPGAAQQKQQQANNPNQPNTTGDPNVPTLQQGALKPGLESARAAWGALPQRVRDMLLQGASDRFSAKYQQLTEQYYKRLAEEGTK